MAGTSLSKTEIAARLNISYPFLLLDRVENLIPGQSAVGHRQLKADDWFFGCHLPSEQVMPGTLLTEAMLQTLVLVIYAMTGHEARSAFIVDIQTRLYEKVGPGSDLTIEAKLSSYKRGVAKGEAITWKDAKRVATGLFTFASPHDMAQPKVDSR